MSPARGDSLAHLAIPPDGFEAVSLQRLLQDHESSAISSAATEASTACESPDREARLPLFKYPAPHTLFQKLRAVISVHLAPSKWFPPAPKKKLRPTAWLDGLRGYAALSVYIFHVVLFWYPGAGRGWAQTKADRAWYRFPFIRNVYYSGHADVGIFFVISGFVLTQKSLGFIRARNFDALYKSLASAVFRRWFRLWIPVIVSTFLIMLLTSFGFHNIRAEQQATFALQFYDWCKETNRLMNPFSYRSKWENLLDKYDWATWTIPLEYYGSMVCYVVLLALSRIASNATRGVIVAILTVYSVSQGSWFTMCFLAGMLIADYDLHVAAQNRALEEDLSLDPAEQQKRKHTTAGTIFWTLLFILANYLAGAPDHGTNSPGYRTLFKLVPEVWLENPHDWYDSWTGILMVLSISRHPYIHRLFETPVAQFFARISYSLYLMHDLVYIFLIDDWLRPNSEAYFGVWRTEKGEVQVSGYNSYGYEWAFTLCFIIETAVTIPLAILFERWVDAPSVKFTRFFESWIISGPKEEEVVKQRE